MADQPELEKLYREAQSALKSRDYVRASELLTQILVIDENYKDTSRLLADIVREKRRRWYNDVRIWGTLGVLLLIGAGFFIAPKLSSYYAAQPSAPVINPTTTPSPTPIANATATLLPTPTPIPLTWKRISIGQEFARDTITSIVVDPKDRDVIYIGMQSAGTFKSIDGGDSWAPIQQGLENAHIMSLAIHPEDTNTLFAATQGGLFVTDDGGESWIKKSERIGKFLLVDPRNGSHLYLGDGKSIFESSNKGTSWTQTHAGGNCPSEGRDYNNLIMDPTDSNTLFATITVMDECRGVYRSTNNGRSWTRLGLMHAGAFVIVQDEDGNSIFLAAGNDSTDSNVLFISKNNGKDWSRQQTYNCSILITQPQDPSSAYCGVEEGGLFVISPRGGVLQSGIASEQVTAIQVDNYNGQKRIIAGVEKNGLFISLDGGKTWSQKTGGIGASNLMLKTSTTNINQMFVSTSFKNYACTLYRSDDHGGSWEIFWMFSKIIYVRTYDVVLRSVYRREQCHLYNPTPGTCKSLDGGTVGISFQCHVIILPWFF